MSSTWFSIQAKGDTADISIHDEIGFFGVSGKQMLDEIGGLSGVSTINLSVHSPGGDVLDGYAIFNALKEHPAEVHAKVEGLAGSMASVILMAADHVTMPENAFLMIHNPWIVAMGDAEEMANNAATLEKIQSGIVSIYSQRTGLDVERVQELMDAESYITAAEAVEWGFADEMTEAFKAAACAADWREKLPKNFPKGLAFSRPDSPEPPEKPKKTQDSTNQQPIDNMSEPTAPAAPKEEKAPAIDVNEVRAQERERINKISAIGQKMNVPEKDINAAIDKGTPVPAFQATVLDNFEPEAFTATIDGADLHASDRVGDSSAENYSLFKAIREAGDQVDPNRLTGLEREVQDSLEEKYFNATGQVASGILVPKEFWNSPNRQTPQNAATVSTGTSGGNTVETEMQGLTNYLKDYSILPRLGVTIFNDAVGNLEFPRSTAGYSGTWDAETDTIANADATFAANLTLSPKRVGAGTAVSKQLLAQSSVDFEAWVSGELRYAIATALDRGAITGAGGDAPTGVLSASGTDAYAFQVGNSLHENIVDMMADYRDNSAPFDRAQWLCDINVWSDWKKTQIAASTGIFGIQQDVASGSYSVEGRPLHEHTDVTANKVILADWSRLFLATWGGVQLTVDPYSSKNAGQVELYAEMFADCGILQPNAFVIGDNGTTHAGSLS